MKNIQSLKSSHKNKKNKKINLQNMNEYEISFSFGELTSIIFVSYFAISSLTNTNNLSKHSGVILK